MQLATILCFKFFYFPFGSHICSLRTESFLHNGLEICLCVQLDSVPLLQEAPL